MLYSLLVSLIENFSVFNVFKYITFRTGLSVITSLLIVFLIGGPFIETFSKRGISVLPVSTFSRIGIDKLKADNFNKMNFKKATKYLTKMGRTEFFEHVRGTTTVTLYNDKETWELLGYEGASYDEGGYINRGFNDLDWLPEPRIEEHPDLAAFLSESPTRFAEIKKMIANELN